MNQSALERIEEAAAAPRPSKLETPQPATVIELEDLALRYRLAKQRIPSFKEYAIHLVKGALQYEDLWAVDGVSLTIRSGESVGIVGRNGAGKSSLLKLISGILRPTRGRCTVTGRVAPILELGTGFDFELTGHENIYLNGLLLGHSRRDIDTKVADIVQFSGLGDFVHSPLRNYSSGMMARLGFAIATAWISDVLILDEVLAVGDARFRSRCEERMERLIGEGAAVLMVSHSAEAIRDNCRRAVWLEKGRVRADGDVEDVLEAYEAFAEQSEV